MDQKEIRLKATRFFNKGDGTSGNDDLCLENVENLKNGEIYLIEVSVYGSCYAVAKKIAEIFIRDGHPTRVKEVRSFNALEWAVTFINE